MRSKVNIDGAVRRCVSNSTVITKLRAVKCHVTTDLTWMALSDCHVVVSDDVVYCRRRPDRRNSPPSVPKTVTEIEPVATEFVRITLEITIMLYENTCVCDHWLTPTSFHNSRTLVIVISFPRPTPGMFLHQTVVVDAHRTASVCDWPHT